MSTRARLLLVVGGLALCALATAGLYRLMGASGIALAAPLWGAALAIPLLDGLAGAARAIRALAWRGAAGRYYAHRGRWVDVVEDDAGRRFVRLAHVRHFLPGLPADASLAHRYAGRTITRGALAWLHDEALLDYLAKAGAADSLRLRHWLERDVVLPGRRRRELDRAKGPEPG